MVVKWQASAICRGCAFLRLAGVILKDGIEEARNLRYYPVDTSRALRYNKRQGTGSMAEERKCRFMRTLIVYGSTYGCTRACAGRLKELLQGEVAVVNAKESVPDVQAFDIVLIGGSIRMGRIQKEVTRFCKNNLAALRKKRIGLFICCCTSAAISDYINHFFPPALLHCAEATANFGGILQYDKMNWFYRKLLQSTSEKRALSGNTVSQVDDEAIRTFAAHFSPAADA